MDQPRASERRSWGSQLAAGHDDDAYSFFFYTAHFPVRSPIFKNLGRKPRKDQYLPRRPRTPGGAPDAPPVRVPAQGLFACSTFTSGRKTAIQSPRGESKWTCSR